MTRPRRARRIAIGNNKGGARKSTTAVRLAEALAVLGHKVGIAEMDPQGNASRRLGYKDSPTTPTLGDALHPDNCRDGIAAGIWQPCGWNTEYASRISLLPSRYTLEDRAAEAGHKGAWRRLTRALNGADAHLDFVLIDLQPSLGHLTQMSLAAADHVLVPFEPEYDCLEAAVRFRDFVQSSREDLANDWLDVIGYIPSGYDIRLTSHFEQLTNARTLFGELLWDPVPRRSLLMTADQNAQPLAEINGSGEIRAVYEILARRLLEATP
ncbi:ParA family protein [Streptomyces sp. NPDC094049]|uniref:ParA family protein n=1 Tax=Streptomyces sp. NPDC094049 TaxID=3154987 RepID=UPI003327C6F7